MFVDIMEYHFGGIAGGGRAFFLITTPYQELGYQLYYNYEALISIKTLKLTRRGSAPPGSLASRWVEE